MAGSAAIIIRADAANIRGFMGVLALLVGGQTLRGFAQLKRPFRRNRRKAATPPRMSSATIVLDGWLCRKAHLAHQTQVKECCAQRVAKLERPKGVMSGNSKA